MNKEKILNIALLFIILMSAFMRLYRVEDYMTFLGDEGRDVLVVKRMITGEKFTLLGPTASVGGFFLGPAYYYFMIPFLWAFNLDPVGPAVMVALFGIATTYLIYIVGKELFNAKTGLVASTIYSLSPLVIAYSRSSWNPNLMPFFSLLVIFLSWLTVTKNKWRYLFWIGFFLGIAFQMHYLTSFLTLIIMAYLLYFGRLKKTKEYGLGIAGFILGLSPFFIFEIKHNFPNIRSLAQFLLKGKEVGASGGNFFTTIADVTFRLFHRLVTNNTTLLSYGILLLSLILFFFSWNKRKNEEKTNKTYLLMFLWGALGILLFGFYKKGIYDYYFGFMFALPFLLTGHVLSFLSKNFLGKIIAAILFISLVWVNWQGRPFRFIPNRQLAQTKEITKFAFDKTGGKPFNYALITGQNSDHAYRYFFEIWGNRPVVIENTQVDPQRESVTDQLIVICEKTDCQPLGNSLWEVAGFGRAEIAGEWDVSVVKVFRLIPYKETNSN